MISATDYTPAIKFDLSSCILEISGNSFPENAQDFYRPIMKWMDEHLLFAKEGTKIIFKLDYISTASSKVLLNMMMLLKDKIEANKGIEVVWCYRDWDEDIFNQGKRMSDITQLEVNFQTF